MDGGTEARLYSVVGRRVRERRKQAGLTQAALAEQIRLTRTSVTNIERGRQKVPLHHLLRIAQELDADLRDLLPTPTELNFAKGPVSVNVDGKAVEVPVEASGLIQRFMERREEGERNERSSSRRGASSHVPSKARRR